MLCVCVYITFSFFGGKSKSVTLGVSKLSSERAGCVSGCWQDKGWRRTIKRDQAKEGGKENRVGDVKKVAEGRERRREIRDWVSIERLLDAELREVIRLLTEKAKSQ